MVCTGAKSERQARKAVLKVIDELKRDGIVILGKPDITIQNIVASAGLGGFIDLAKVNYGVKKKVYEPEQFFSLIFQIDEPHGVYLHFVGSELCFTRCERGKSSW